jgi:hypothetical protein
MNMKYILRSVGLSAIGLALLGWISVWFTGLNTIGPDGESNLLQWYFDNLVQSEEITSSGMPWEDLAVSLYNLLAQMTTALLSAAVVAALLWSIGSHFLNVDAPGKAKFYFIYWVVFTGIFMAIVVGIVFWFTKSSAFNAADYLSGSGVTTISIISFIYYFLVYYLGVLLGTARFARSSILFGNKIPVSSLL